MERTIDTCWFKGKCKKECAPNCNIFMEFKYLLDTSGLPVNYREPKKLQPDEEDLNTFITLAEIKDDIYNFVKEGKFLYLWGENTGSGKSNWVCKIALTYMALIANGNGFNQDNGVQFCYVPEFILMTTSFKDENRDEYLKSMLTKKLLILDDIGSCDSGKFAETNLASIIDMRYRNGLSTLFTSNLSESGLEAQYGARITDRILSGLVLEIKGASRRESKYAYKKGE